MIYLSENTHILLLFLLLLIALIVYFKMNFQQIKAAEIDRLNLIVTEIEAEKKTSEQLKNLPQEIVSLKKGTQQKLQKIKIDILDIDFTLSEIF